MTGSARNTATNTISEDATATAADSSDTPGQPDSRPAVDSVGDTHSRRRGTGGGLGLQPLSVADQPAPALMHSPTSMSVSSGRSRVESISGESKRSSGMSFVRKLRRLSSAALQGKVNRLFSRSNNASQDSLATQAKLGEVSSTRYISPSLYSSPGAIFSDVSGAETSDQRQLGRMSVGPAMRSVQNLSNMSPGTVSLSASSRRHRAFTTTITQVSEQKLNGLEPKESDSSDQDETANGDEVTAKDPGVALKTSGDSTPSGGQRIAQHFKAKGVNPPLIASPLSRRSLSMAEDDDETDTNSQLATSDKPAVQRPSMPVPHVTRSIFPKLSRTSIRSQTLDDGLLHRTKSNEPSSSSSMAGTTPRLSYQFNDGFVSDVSLQPAAHTPSPLPNSIGRSNSQIVTGSSSPPLQRRRTALSALDWSDPNSGSSTARRSGSHSGSITRRRQGSTMSQESPSGLLSAYQIKRRLSSILMRHSNTGVSSRSSISATSDSVQSWTSAASNTDGAELEISHRRSAAVADESRSDGEEANGGNNSQSTSVEPGFTEFHSGWATPGASQHNAMFDPSMLDWRLSQDVSATRTYSSTSSTAQEHMQGTLGSVSSLPGSEVRASSHAGIPFTVDYRRTGSLPSRAPSSVAGSSDILMHRYPSEPIDYEASSMASTASNAWSNTSTTPAPPALPGTVYPSQHVRPRGTSQPVHLARAATTNAIRLKEKGAMADSRTAPVLRTEPGSAPEPSNVEAVMNASAGGNGRIRGRATSASAQPTSTKYSVAADSGSAGHPSMARQHSSSAGQPLLHGLVTGLPSGSRPGSSMSQYTMSPAPSSIGEDHYTGMATGWQQPALAMRASPDSRTGEMIIAGQGMHTPSSTSSPPTHYHHGMTSGHPLRLNTTSVQRSASGHSVSSGISELLEPSTVSQARKDALWQVLVVSKSRADSNIDKLLREWRETDSGAIVCGQDTEGKSTVGDDDAMIMKVKRGHRRSTSDIMRADGERNEFRRRVLELIGVIRGSTVADLSNVAFTSSLTEQLFGLLTQQRTRFSTDANIGSLILDVLYHFSTVSQTVSQLAVPVNPFASIRGMVSGEASPAISQYPSPLLMPDAAARGMPGMIPLLSSALASQPDTLSSGRTRELSEPASTPLPAPPTFSPRAASASPMPSFQILEADEAKEQLRRTSTDTAVLAHALRHTATSNSEPFLGAAGTASTGSARARPQDTVSRMSSPRLAPGTAHSSTASLISLLPSGAGGASSTAGSVGRSGSVHGGTTGSATPMSGHSGVGGQSRQRSYLQALGSLLSGGGGGGGDADQDVETPVIDPGVSTGSRPSLDDTQIRRSLTQRPSRISVVSEMLEPPTAASRPKRTSLQVHHQPTVPAYQSGQLKTHKELPAMVENPPRITRPATMYGAVTMLGPEEQTSESRARHEKLAQILGDGDNGGDYGESPPASPTEPITEATGPASHTLPPTAQLPELPTIYAGNSEAGTESTHSVKQDLSAESAAEPAAEDIKPIPEEEEESSAVVAAVDATEEPKDGASGEETVICRMCEREFLRSELNSHSDVCMLEQTRALKLEEANQRIKRLRDSAAKRLGDLKKVRKWDKLAMRESERVVRVAERAIVWPDGESHHDLIVAKAKFAKYTDKLDRITGSNSVSPLESPSTALPRADIETMWMAKQLQNRIHEKLTIIEEFDKEFSRLERQAELMREAEDADKDDSLMPVPAAVPAIGEEVMMPTWSQLTHFKNHSPTASARTSIDIGNSDSGAATPDLFAVSRASSTQRDAASGLGYRQSKPLRPGRRSLSRHLRHGNDVSETDSHASSSSGSRKLVSLFAALFRGSHHHNHGHGHQQSVPAGRNNRPGIFGSGNQQHSYSQGAGKDSTSGSTIAGPTATLRRKSSSSPFVHATRPSNTKTAVKLRITPQHIPSITLPSPSTPLSQPSTPSPAASHTPTGLSISTNMYSAPNSATAAAAPSSGEQSAAMSPSVTRQRTNSTFANCRSASDSASKAQRMPSIDDFDFVKPISRGAFGRVYLVRKKATKDLYAIKVMRKKDMINKNMVTQALAERRALSLLSTDWVVQLYYAFHSTKHLFLVMEYLIGGDLAGLLRVWGVMDEDAAKFYIGEVASAIDYLHRNSIVHRDIKPDNVILGSDGHIKLSDFGLSQVAVRGSGSGAEGKGAPDSADSPGTVDLNIASSSSSGAASENEVDKSDEYWTLELSKPGREAQAPASATNNPHAGKAPPPSKRAHARNKSSRGFLGTPDYLAPELLLGAGNGLAVDWWALGVCLFEFLCGYPPFTDESPEAIFRNILNHAIDWPDVEGYMSDEAASLIKALLQPNPSKRAHWKDIKTSSLFEDWDLSNIRDIEPPFVPMPDDDADTSYFEPCQRTEIQRLSNATFLQADSPRRAHPLLPSKLNDSQPSATISAKKDIGVLRGFPGVSGERRMSQPALFPPGASQPGGSPSIGQLKKLFSEMSAENLAKKSPASNDASPEPAASKEESIASADSSDKYSFKEDGREEGATGDDIEEVSTSEMAKTESSSTRNSLNSLSESDFEQIGEDDLEPTSPIIPPPPPVVASTYSTDAGIVLPPLPVGHSKFASLSRTPSQHSDGIQDGQPVSNVSSKSHSRCTSVQILMNGKKPNVIPSGGRSRRPSRGVDSSNLSEVDLKTSLQRANSVEDRHAHVSRPGSVVGSETGEIINSAGIDPGSASEEEMPDEETERAFDDFTYKNLALLSHVNKGVSSSGNSTPQTEKQGSASASASATPIPVAQQKRDNSSAPRTSSYSSVAGMVRNSPINAYDTKASPD